MYDYLSASGLSADYTSTELTTASQRIIPEVVKKNQVIHYGDDNTAEVITYSNDPIFNVTLQWDVLSPASAGTIFDFYTSTSKANGIENTFYWQDAADSHTYTARFVTPLQRAMHLGSIHEIGQVTLQILGIKPPV